jgi:hypothetical protein
LEDRYAAGDTRNPQALEKQIVEVSLSTSVLSRFTAYVAVDRSEVVNEGGRQEQLVQPVEAPEGWGVFANLCQFHEAPEALARYSLSAKASSFLKRSARARSALSQLFSRQVRPLEDVVAKIRALLEKLAEPQHLSLHRRHASVKQLAELLRELALLLRRNQNATADAAAEAVEELAQNASDLLDDYQAGNKEALDAEHLSARVAKVREVLDKIGQQSSSDAKRQRFWT